MKPVARYWKKFRSNRRPLRGCPKPGGVRARLFLSLILLALALAFLPPSVQAGIALPSSPPNKIFLPSPEREGKSQEVNSPADAEKETMPGVNHRRPAERLDVEINRSVSNRLQRYQTKERGSLLEGFRKAEAYLAQVKAVFERMGLPADLCNLAFLESGFNPFAYSRAGAVGIWQFMESTARLFGLQVNWWVDERRDPEKSTRAAAAYLKQLYELFGSWPLAIAAYNTGEVKVLKALRGRPQSDFWSLHLPRETWRLVSGFMAVTLILREPEAYFFPPIQEDSPRYTKVAVDSCTDLRVIARACETSLEEIRALNPELNWGCTPPDRTHYEVRIPLEAKYSFSEAFSAIPSEERIAWTRHSVQKGETLSRIARRYRVPVPIIAQMNHLPSYQTLPAGKELLLPIPHGFRRGMAETHLAYLPSLRRAEAASFSQESPRSYVVQRGDTLLQIARRHWVTVRELRQANGLGPQAVIRPGDRLRIPGGRSL